MMPSIVSLKADHGAFPVADCPTCGGRTLVWLDVSAEGEAHRCLACNSVLEATSTAEVGARGVRSLGYVFLDEARESARTTVKQNKCGPGGVRGCGSGGCSSGGSCGSGGTCGGCG